MADRGLTHQLMGVASKTARNLLRQKEATIFLALVGIVVLIALSAPNFLTARNAFSVSRQISFLAILAIGELFVILTAGIDLSVGSIVGLSGVTTGLAMTNGIVPLAAVAIGLGTGLACGLISGVLVAYVKVTPFIVTLGMLSVVRGAVWVITEGWPITDIPQSFLMVGRSQIFGVAFPVVVLLGIAIVAFILLNYTAYGRRSFAIGGNEEATILSGIDVRRVKLAAYAISGVLAAVVGILLVARFSSAQSAAGEGWELDSIAAAVIGGTSLMGGSGSVLGVIIGASIMGVIRNGLVLMRVSVYWQTLVIGVIIILAAIIDRKRDK